jgi:hypothetical protein
VKTRRKMGGGGDDGFQVYGHWQLTNLIGPASLFEDHVTQTAEDLNSRFMYWREPTKFHSTLQMVCVFVCVHITYMCVFFSMEIKKVMQKFSRAGQSMYLS